MGVSLFTITSRLFSSSKRTISSVEGMSLAVAVPWSLPGRPAEHSPAQHVQMDVVHRLASACIHVEYSAVAFFVDIRLHSKFLGDLEHLADERAVLRLQIIQCRNVLLGHHQEMNGSLRPKILKCYDEVVLMHKVRGCFVLNDSAKKTRLLHGFNLALLGVILCTTLLAGTSIFQNPAPTASSAVNALQHSRAFRCAERCTHPEDMVGITNIPDRTDTSAACP